MLALRTRSVLSRSGETPAVSEPPNHTITAVPGITVGHFTDRVACTGCTVVLAPPGGAVAACHVAGGAPGTRETDALQPGNLVERAHAVLLTGGSAFGLDAAAGVMRWLEERGEGFPTTAGPVPIVAAAVLFDLAVGRADVRPGAAQGYAAARLADAGPVAEGSVGAGTGATVAKAGGMARALKGGVGSAATRLVDGAHVGVLVAVNAFGDVVDPADGMLIAGPRTDDGGMTCTSDLIARGELSGQIRGLTNTTLVVVATDALLDRPQALRVAHMAHAGIARALRPSHSPGDGDTVFVLASGGGPAVDAAGVIAAGSVAADLTAAAIDRGVRLAHGLGGLPSAAEWRSGR